MTPTVDGFSAFVKLLNESFKLVSEFSVVYFVENVGIHVRTYKFKVIFDVYNSKLWICSKLNRIKYQASSCTLRLYAIGVWVGRNTWIKLVSDLFILQLWLLMVT